MKKNIIIWLTFFVITFLLRSYSFFYSVIDWDESLYLLIAEAWSHGNIPYVTIWDQKPPGIYLCFLLGKVVGLGDTLVGIRILSVVAVSTSAFLLYRISHSLTSNKSYFVYAPALLYIVFTLVNQGLAANTEIFYTPFILGGFCAVQACIRPDGDFQIRPFILLLSGLLFGFAFQIKYLTAFDLIALTTGIIVLVFIRSPKNSLLTIGKIGLFMVIGFILPNVGVVLYFQYHNHLQDLLDATLNANVQHSTHGDFSIVKTAGKFYLQFRDQVLLWGGTLLAIILLVKGYFNTSKKGVVIFLLGWLVLDLLSISVTKRFYPHYFLQALPPLCLLFYVTLEDFIEASTVLMRRCVLGLLAIFIFIGTVLPVLEETMLTLYFRTLADNPYWNDSSTEIADFIKKDLDPNDYIFVGAGQPIIYYLTQAKIPTKFPYPPFFLDDHFRHVSGIDQVGEIRSILEKKPKFIISRKLAESSFYQHLEPYLLRDYREIKVVDGKSIFLRTAP